MSKQSFINCNQCQGENFLHHLECSKTTKLLSENDEPQEFKITSFMGIEFKIQSILHLGCHRCGGVRTFTRILTSEDTKKLGIGYKKGEICYCCVRCGLTGIVELNDEKLKLIKNALMLEGYEIPKRMSQL